jgi:hypothetical protein
VQEVYAKVVSEVAYLHACSNCNSFGSKRKLEKFLSDLNIAQKIESMYIPNFKMEYFSIYK